MSIRDLILSSIGQAYALFKTDSVEILTVARNASTDAVVMLHKGTFDLMPMINLSDDGVLGVQWHFGNYGTALIFVGDGTASLAVKTPTQLYAESADLSFSVKEPLPDAFLQALATVMDQAKQGESPRKA